MHAKRIYVPPRWGDTSAPFHWFKSFRLKSPMERRSLTGSLYSEHLIGATGTTLWVTKGGWSCFIIYSLDSKQKSGLSNQRVNLFQDEATFK